MNRQEDMKLNVGVMGAAGVGKTNIINRILDLPFDPRYNPTRGIQITDSDVFKFFDFAGQEVYGDFEREIIDSLDVCILVYDVASKLSEKSLRMWKEKLNPATKTITIGNKIDLKPEILPDTVSCRRNVNLAELAEKIKNV